MDGIDSGNDHATRRRLTCSGLYPLVGDAKLVTVAMRCSGSGTVRFSVAGLP